MHRAHCNAVIAHHFLLGAAFLSLLLGSNSFPLCPPFYLPCLLRVWLQIDASGNRLKELEKALLNPAFASFMYQTLDEVAAKSA